MAFVTTRHGGLVKQIRLSVRDKKRDWCVGALDERERGGEGFRHESPATYPSIAHFAVAFRLFLVAALRRDVLGLSCKISPSLSICDSGICPTDWQVASYTRNTVFSGKVRVRNWHHGTGCGEGGW